jgi:hypothetical protein
MLKVASYALQAVTIIALSCAAVIRARTEVHARADRAPIPAALAEPRMAVAQWIDDTWGWGEAAAVHKQESIHQSFRVQSVAGPRVIDIENISGSIEVVGGDGDGVQMDVDKSIDAASNQALERAQKQVTLDVEQEPGLLKMKVKDASRCTWPDCWHFEDHSYRVEMNFRLQVPRDSDLTLKTVDGHDVRVRNVNGSFSISNVNGAITMDDVAGSGTARTVNGAIKVRFRENPTKDSQFASVNGGVDLYFAKDLSADFRFKTFSGSVYSDFPLLAAPVTAPVQQRRGTAFYFRTNAFAGGRVGSGGPLIGVESLNGDVRILEKHD